jgi:hypothetical protein
MLLVFAIEAKPRLVDLSRPEDLPRLVDWLEGCGDPRVRNLLEAAIALVTEPCPDPPCRGGET